MGSGHTIARRPRTPRLFPGLTGMGIWSYDHKSMELRRLEALFRALADANRLRIVALLLGGERCVCEIQSSLGLTQSNVSRHLSYLKHSGLVSDERRGPRVFYRLSAEIRQEAGALLEFLGRSLSGKQGTRAGGVRRRKRRARQATGALA